MTRRMTRMERRRQWAMARIQGAGSARDRMAAAWDYLRSTLGDIEPALSDVTADSVTTELIRTADDARREDRDGRQR